MDITRSSVVLERYNSSQKIPGGAITQTCHFEIISNVTRPDSRSASQMPIWSRDELRTYREEL